MYELNVSSLNISGGGNWRCRRGVRERGILNISGVGRRLLLRHQEHPKTTGDYSIVVPMV